MVPQPRFLCQRVISAILEDNGFPSIQSGCVAEQWMKTLVTGVLPCLSITSPHMFPKIKLLVEVIATPGETVAALLTTYVPMPPVPVPNASMRVL